MFGHQISLVTHTDLEEACRIDFRLNINIRGRDCGYKKRHLVVNKYG